MNITRVTDIMWKRLKYGLIADTHKRSRFHPKTHTGKRISVKVPFKVDLPPLMAQFLLTKPLSAMMIGLI